MHFVTAPALREEQLEALLLDVAARVTLQSDRYREKRDKAASNDDDPLQASHPSFAAILRQSLFGKDELEALKAPPGKGLAPATPRRVGRLCLESQGFNIHAATRVHECARDRLEHLVRYVCRPAIAAKRLEAVGDRQARPPRIHGAAMGRARQQSLLAQERMEGWKDRRSYDSPRAGSSNSRANSAA